MVQTLLALTFVGVVETLLLLTTVGLVTGMVVAINGLRDKGPHRKLARVPVQAIAAVTPGATVRLTGTVQSQGELLTAPMSGRKCVYYLVLVEEYRRAKGRSKTSSWYDLLREEKHVDDFLLKDATGLARIRMAGAHVLAVPDHKTRSGTFDNATPVEAAFLERFQTLSTAYFGLNRSLRYTEGVIEPGEAVTLLGLTRAGEGDVSLVVEAPPDQKLLLTDAQRAVKARPKSA